MSMGMAENGARWRAVRSANLELRPAERRVLADGRHVAVTVREFETLLVLAARRNRVVPRAELYALVWGGQMTYRDRSVDVFVRRVRKKLDAAAPGWKYIHTHVEIGYRFAPERRATEARRSDAVVERRRRAAQLTALISDWIWANDGTFWIAGAWPLGPLTTTVGVLV
jgi:DNA-binding winged helix-turn-helix (wHTH) protein